MQDLVGKCSGSYNPSAINCLTTINASVAVGLKVNSHQSTFQDLFSVTTGFHNFLQKESIDLAQAVADLYARTKGLCKANHIDIQGPSDRGQRLVDMKQLATSLVDAEQPKRNLLFPCLERIIDELEKRFSVVNGDSLTGIRACSPMSDSFFV